MRSVQLTEEFRGRAIAVGNCSHCTQKRVLVMDDDHGFCNRCISEDPYLSARYGWS